MTIGSLQLQPHPFGTPPPGGASVRIFSHIPPTHENRVVVVDGLTSYFTFDDMRSMIRTTSADNLEHIHLIQSGDSRETVAWAIVDWFTRHPQNLFEVVAAMFRHRKIPFEVVQGAPPGAEVPPQPDPRTSSYQPAPPPGAGTPSPATTAVYRAQPPASGRSVPPSSGIDEDLLYEVLKTKFAPYELDNLLRKLGINPDDVPAAQTTLPQRARAILDHVKRAGRLAELYALVKRDRPLAGLR